MTMQKEFEYNGKTHTVVCNYKPYKFSIEFDGVTCPDVKKLTYFGGKNLMATVDIDGETHTIRVVGKNIYIYNSKSQNIETELTKPEPKMDIVSWGLMLMPLIPLFVIFYVTVVRTNIMSMIFSQPLSAIMFFPYLFVFVFLSVFPVRIIEGLFKNPERERFSACALSVLIFLISFFVCVIFGTIGILVLLGL